MKVSFESEAEMEEVISKNYRVIKSIVSKFHKNCDGNVPGFTRTQTNMSSYGRSDITLFYRYLNVDRVIVVELKNRKVEAKDFSQLSKYMTYLKECYEFNGKWKPSGGLLVGMNGASDESTLLYNQLKNNLLWGDVSFDETFGLTLNFHSKSWTRTSAVYPDDISESGNE